MKTPLAIFFFVMPIALLAHTGPFIQNGKGEITQSQLNHKAISLDGQWEFYWNQLLTPDSFSIKRPTVSYQTVPLRWDLYKINNEQLSVLGYCTYRLILSNPDRINDLLIKIPGIATASKIWINGKLVSQQGTLATRAEDSQAERFNHFIRLPDSERLTIVIQASNYEYSFPGISHPVMIGHEVTLRDRENLINDFEMIEIGCLLLMIFYHLGLYLQLKRNPSYLILSLLCMAVLIRTTTTYNSSLLFFRLFPSIDFSIMKKLEFGFSYVSLMLLPMFIQSLFEQDTPRMPVRIFQICSGLLVLLVLFTPPYIFGQALNVFHALMTTSFIFVLWVIYRAIRHKRQGGWFVFSGILICCIFVEFEMLMVSDILPENAFPFPNPVGIGVVIFLLFQSLGLSVRFAKAFKDVEDLTYALEKRVEKRTEELSRANLVKDKLFSIISHDLRSPLNSLRGLLDLTGNETMSPQELQQLLPAIRQNLNGSLSLLDNLLNWASTQLKGMNVKSDRLKLAPIVEENINLYKTIAKNKNIKLTSAVGPLMEVVADANMTKLIVRNLVSNGIKFTPSGGSVEISAQMIAHEIEVCVADTGVGLPSEFKDRIFEVDINRTTRGTNNEKGTGIGLLLCREFVEKNNGRLWVESGLTKGSKFKFTLPSPAL
jgi:two-component system sensor histidine kinase ChiS